MGTLQQHEILVMLLALATLLASARFLGELARRFGLPSVLGEILAGILLGPTVLGNLLPAANAYLFPQTGPNALVLHGIATFSVILFLLVAGTEVDLSTIVRLRRSAAMIGVLSIGLPFTLGSTLGWIAPSLMGREPGADGLVFALFIGIAMAISALPVIAKTLMDLNLYRTDLGMIVIATAIFQDLVGWIVFAIVLGLMAKGSASGASIATTAGLTLCFAGLMLTVGRRALDRALPWVQAHTAWPGGILAFAVVVALLAAAATEAIGVHALFGAFLVGVALGDSPHLRERTRRTIEQFVGSVFAPLFFASIGLRVDFVRHFDPLLVAIVVLVACVSQSLGGALGATWAGFPRRHAWAIGFALNARGAMEIVLALLALQHGVIGERLFVALVVMALLTSVMAGPTIQRVLHRRKTIRFADLLHGRTFVADLEGTAPNTVIRELTALAMRTATAAGAETIERATQAVLERELTMPTALDHGIAVPHARLAGLAQPIVAVGLSREGVDFNARDGRPSRLVFLVLTPEKDVEAQLEILADIARTFADRTLAVAASECRSFTEFMALLKSGAPPERAAPAKPLPTPANSR